MLPEGNLSRTLQAHRKRKLIGEGSEATQAACSFHITSAGLHGDMYHIGKNVAELGWQQINHQFWRGTHLGCGEASTIPTL